MEQSKKFFPLLLCSVLFTLTLSFVCFAGSWKQDAKGYWYQNDDGSYPQNTWQWIDADGDHIAYCYYFDAEGYCLLNQKTPDGYLVSSSGEWIFDELYFPATKLVNTPNVDANVLPYLSASIHYGMFDPFNEKNSFSVDFTEKQPTAEQTNLILTVLSSPYYVESNFPDFAAKYFRTVRSDGEKAIALDWDSYRQVLEDLFGLDVSDKAWESTIKGGENYNLINKDTAVFGVGDFGAEEPYFNTESIIFEDGKWIVKGKFAFVFIEGGARKYSYRIVAEENPHSIFGHLTVQKLKVTKE